MNKDDAKKLQKELETENGKRPCVVVIYKLSNEGDRPVFSKALTCSTRRIALEYLSENKYKFDDLNNYYTKKNRKKIANILETKLYK